MHNIFLFTFDFVNGCRNVYKTFQNHQYLASPVFITFPGCTANPDTCKKDKCTNRNMKTHFPIIPSFKRFVSCSNVHRLGKMHGCDSDNKFKIYCFCLTALGVPIIKFLFQAHKSFKQK